MTIFRRIIGLSIMAAALYLIVSAVLNGVSAFSLDDMWRDLSQDQQTALTLLSLGYVVYVLGKWVKGRSYMGQVAAQVTAAPALAQAMTPTQVGFSEDRAAIFTKEDGTDIEPVSTPERVRTHEAGHAAVALYLGFSLAQVSTITIGNSGGRVQIGGHPAGNQSNEAFWNKAIMASAGGATELALLGEASAGGVTQDVEEVQLICATLAAADYEVGGQQMTASDLAEEARRQAKICVAEVLPHIEAIVAQLEETPHITGKRAAEVFDQVGKAA